MAVPRFLKQSLVLENYEENTKAPCNCLNKVETAESLYSALVNQTSVLSIFRLSQNQWYICDTRQCYETTYRNFGLKIVCVPDLAACSVFDV